MRSSFCVLVLKGILLFLNGAEEGTPGGCYNAMALAENPPGQQLWH